MNLMFWISLIPFTTAWMGENHFAAWPVFLYALNTLIATAAFTLLTWAAVRLHGPQSEIARAVGKNGKGVLTLVIYAAAVATALFSPVIAGVFLVIAPAIWLVPDRRFVHKPH